MKVSSPQQLNQYKQNQSGEGQAIPAPACLLLLKRCSTRNPSRRGGIEREEKRCGIESNRKRRSSAAEEFRQNRQHHKHLGLGNRDGHRTMSVTVLLTVIWWVEMWRSMAPHVWRRMAGTHAEDTNGRLQPSCGESRVNHSASGPR